MIGREKPSSSRLVSEKCFARVESTNSRSSEVVALLYEATATLTIGRFSSTRSSSTFLAELVFSSCTLAYNARSAAESVGWSALRTAWIGW